MKIGDNPFVSMNYNEFRVGGTKSLEAKNTVPPASDPSTPNIAGSPALTPPSGVLSKVSEWTAIPSPSCLVAQLLIEENAHQRETNKQIIRAEGLLMVENINQQADKIREGAITAFACSMVAGLVTMASGALQFGMAANMKIDTKLTGDALSIQGAQINRTSTMAGGLGKSIEGVGGMIGAGGQLGQGLAQAEGKKLEAEAEKIRMVRDQLENHNQIINDLISKALDFMNNMQSSVNQTRTKILG